MKIQYPNYIEDWVYIVWALALVAGVISGLHDIGFWQ